MARASLLELFAAVILACHHGPASCAAADTLFDEATTTSWAEGHPELLEIFGRPFAFQGMQHRKATFRSWSSQEFPTKFAASQPTLVRGPKTS